MPVDITELRKLKAQADKTKKWASKARHPREKPPWPADCACYYCQYNTGNQISGEEFPDGCKYCLHNPDAVIYEVLEDK